MFRRVILAAFLGLVPLVGGASVEPARLAAALPPVPTGWWAEQANTETVTTSQGTSSAASRSYARNWTASSPSVLVTISDVGGDDATRGGVAGLCQRYGDACKSVSGDGWTGYRADLTESKASELHALVGDRFLVTLQGSNVDAATLDDWLTRVKLDRLREMSR